MSNTNFTRVTDRAGRVANVLESNLILSAKLISTEANLGIQQYTAAGTGTATGAIVTGGLTGGDLYFDQTGYVRIVWT